MSLSLDTFSARICLFSAGSIIATQSHMSSDPTLIMASSTMN